MANSASKFFLPPLTVLTDIEHPTTSCLQVRGPGKFGMFFIFRNRESTLGVLTLILFTCGPQTFESRFERHLLLDFSEVMFAMQQFEQVSEIVSFRFILLCS